MKGINEEGYLIIEDRIYTIRGMQVMIDRDIAALYGVETKRLNEQVRRNINRFPEDFMFQLTKEECLRSQIATLNSEPGKHLKYLPYAFTENGIAMLSSVLRSEIAINVNIRIMRTFTQLRRQLLYNPDLFKRIEVVEYHQLEFKRWMSQTDNKVEKILNKFEERDVRPNQGIFFDGQIFDAYTFVADLIRSAQESIVLIDNYVDDAVLKLLSKRAEGVLATTVRPPQR